MFLSEPGRTAYDINFSLLGFHVRVHPAFFILPLFMGRNLIPQGMNMGIGLLIVTVIFFVSILVHELGHAIAFRYYGTHSRIVLHWMGGLAIPESSGGSWMSKKRSGSLTPNQQIVVSLAGPIFGFLLAAALCGAVYLFRGSIYIETAFRIPLPMLDLRGSLLEGNTAAKVLIGGGIIINIILNLFNLVPIYPLDGGQVARQVMTKMDPNDGPRNSIYVSIACSVLIAVFAIMNGSGYMGLFFGFMAWTNYQTLQSYNGPRW